MFSVASRHPERVSQAGEDIRGGPRVGHKRAPASLFVSLWMEWPKVALHPCEEERWSLHAVSHEPEEAAG